jgi:signal transduction histidine kinase
VATAPLRRHAYHRDMELLREGRDRFALRRLDIVLVAMTIGLSLATVVLIVDPGMGFALPDRSLDVTTNSLIVVAALSLAALALARYRESARVSGLFQSSAFLLMAWLTFINVAMVVFREDARFYLTLGGPPEQSHWPFYVWGLSRIAAAGLLVVGGMAALSMIRRVPRTRRTLLLPALAVSAAGLLLLPLAELLPPFIGPEGIQAMLEETRGARPVPGVTPVGIVTQGAAAGLFVIGALLYRRSYLRDGPVLDGYLAVALVLAAFAEIHFLLYPGIYTSLVTTTDAIRLAFFGVLLLGITSESRSDLRALRAAYAALDRLRQTEAERATLEERTRLARELHDGLAQDLWFAKLKHERLVANVPEDQRELAQEVTQALDAAIAEARQAVVTMRGGIERDRPLHELLAEAVEAFGGESGLRSDFSSADLPPSLPPRTQAEVLRVLQEALTNVRKHADATVVRVSAEVADGTLVLSVIDNGRGFRPEELSGDGLGVQGMRERARLMGGDLHVVSEPSSGTGVHLSVPVTEVASA